MKEGANEITGVLSKVYTIPKQSWLCVEQHYLDNALKYLKQSLHYFVVFLKHKKHRLWISYVSKNILYSLDFFFKLIRMLD